MAYAQLAEDMFVCLIHVVDEPKVMDEVASLHSLVDVNVAYVNSASSLKVKQPNVAPIVASSSPQKPLNPIPKRRSQGLRNSFKQ